MAIAAKTSGVGTSEPDMESRTSPIGGNTTETVLNLGTATPPAQSNQASTSPFHRQVSAPLPTPSGDSTHLPEKSLTRLDPQNIEALSNGDRLSASPASVNNSSTYTNVNYAELLKTGSEGAEPQGINSPFAYTPGQLSKLHDPKNLDVLRAMGGTYGLALGLRTDIAKGLSPDETTLVGTVTLKDVRLAVENLDADEAASRSAREVQGGKGFGTSDNILRDREEDTTPSLGSNRLSRVARSFSIGIGPPVSSPFETRRGVFSENRIPIRKPKTIFQLMWMALKDKVLILLSITAVVSLALGFYQSFRPGATNKVEWVQGVAILIAIAVITVAQALNDYQQERKFMTLNAKKEDRNIRVIRGGRNCLVSIYEVLVGDIMQLEAGDVIPVDGVLIDSYTVVCDESAATGESDAIKKVPADIALRSTQPGAVFNKKFDPFILSGGKVLEGVGSCVVTAVGTNSYQGRNLLSLHKEPEVTPLQLKLNRVANLIVKFGAITAALLFVALFIKFLVQLRGSALDAGGKGQLFIQILIISLIILVIAVPEGLPLAVTLALAYATIRMLKDRNLVRVLKACETMGNATTVCSDKTGTLTQNRMTVVVGTLGVSDNFGTKQRQSAAETTSIDHESSNNIALRQVERQQTGPTPMRKFFLELPSEMRTLLRTSIAINSTAVEIRDPNGGKELVGSKTETALLELGKAYLGLDDLSTERSNHSIVQLFPFSSHRKCMGTVVKHRVERQTEYRLFVKGASEVLLNQSSRVVNFTPNDVSVSPLSKPGQEWIQNTIDEYSSQSLRTISLAYRDFRQWPPEIRKSTRDHYDVDFADVFEGMTWIGVMGIRDPLRPGVLKAVKDCQNAGVFVRMVTGDNVLTAKSVAIECGIFTAGGIIMEGPRFRTLSPTQRDQIIPRLQVLARSSPDDKRILVSCLKQLGDVVAVTGDGTNDGPALRMADVGFSMGLSGTEVAKEASSIILMDDDFGSIVKAIMWGRCVNDAVKKFLQFQLTVTVVAVVLSFVSSIAGNSEESVLSVVQLLWVNLIQDTFAALALATDPPSLVLLQRKPEPKSASIISVNMWKMIMGQSVIQLLITFFLNFAGPRIFTSWTTLEMKTVVFNTFSWLQIFNLINCRRIDNRLNVFTGIHRNWLFIGITLITVGGQVLIIFVGGTAFSITRLNGLQWATSILLGLLSLPFGALIRCIPNSYLESLSLPRFFRRKQRSTSIIESKLTAQVPRTAALEGAQHPTVEEQHERTSMGNSAQNEGPPTPVLDRYASSDSSRHGKYSRSDSTSIAAVREPVSVATSVMRSLSSRPTAVLEDQYPITNRRDLDRFRGIELHPETDPLDPVVGKGSAEFKFLEVRKQLQRREETRGKG